MSNNSSSDEELESIRSFDSYEQANRTEHKPVTINNLNSNVVSERVTSTYQTLFMIHTPTTPRASYKK